MRIFAVICSMLVYVRVAFCVCIPLLPRPPMTVIGIPVPAIIVLVVMTTAIIGTLSVSTLILVIRTIFIVRMTGIIGTRFVVATTLGIAINIFRNHGNSSCKQKKESTCCNHHFFHPTPPAEFIPSQNAIFTWYLHKNGRKGKQKRKRLHPDVLVIMKNVPGIIFLFELFQSGIVHAVSRGHPVALVFGHEVHIGAG